MNKLLLVIILFTQVTLAQTYEAVLEPVVRKTISTQNDGVLLNASNTGDRITKGQIILSQPVELINAEIDQIRLNIKSLVSDLDYYRKLSSKKKEQLGQGIINDEEYETVRHEYFRISQKLASYKIELQKKIIHKKRSTVRADINGVITKGLKQEGEFSRAGEACLEIIDDSILYAVFPLEAAEIHSLKYKSVSVRIADEFHSGSIRSISPEVDAASGLVQVKVAVNNLSLKIRSGEKCTVHLKVKDEQ